VINTRIQDFTCEGTRTFMIWILSLGKPGCHQGGLTGDGSFGLGSAKIVRAAAHPDG
jgi:hypothetical protein